MNFWALIKAFFLAAIIVLFLLAGFYFITIVIPVLVIVGIFLAIFGIGYAAMTTDMTD